MTSPVGSIAIRVSIDASSLSGELQRSINQQMQGITRSVSQSVSSVVGEMNKLDDVSLDNTTRSVDKLTTSLDRADKAAKVDVKADARNVDRARDSLGRFTNDARRAGDAAEDTGRRTKRGFDVGLGSVTKFAAQLGGIIGIATGVGGAIQAGFGRLTSIDDASAKLRGLGHDAASVQTIMDSALASVKGTAFGVGDAANIAASAVAAGVPAGQELTRYLKLTADAAAIAGTSLADMGSIINKVQTNQVAYTDDLQQLADRGIPIFQWLQAEYGVTAVELRKMVSDGKVDAETFQRVIEENIGGAAGTMGSSVSGAIENTKAAIGRLSATLLGPLFQALPGMLGGVTDGLDNIGNAAGPAMDTLSASMSRGRDAVSGLFTLLTTGDFTSTLRESLGIEEDSPIVAGVLRLREIIGAVFDRIREFADSVGGEVFEGLRSAFETITNTASNLWGILQGLWPVLEVGLGVAAFLGDKLLWVGEFVIPLLVDAVNGVGDVIEGFTGWVEDNQTAITIAAGIITAIYLPAIIQWGVQSTIAGAKAVAAWVADTAAKTINAAATVAWTIASTAARSAVVAWTGAQWLLNAALNANPIGIIIIAVVALVAAIVLLWKNSETFRNIVTGAWEAIRNAAMTAWEFLQGVFSAISSWVGDTIVPVFQAMWDKVTAVFEGIVAVISWAWNEIVLPIFDLWWNYYIKGVILPILQVLWDAVMAAFNGIGAAISWVWENVVKLVFDWFVNGLRVLGDFFVWVWQSVIKPAWDALGAGIAWVWENIVKPAWDALTAALDAVGAFFRWVWNDVIKPAWDALGAGITWVWENVIRPVFDFIKSGLDTLGEWFDKTVGFIRTVWDKIREAVGSPVKFIVDVVYNKGIRAAWNKVASWLPGVDELDEINVAELGNFRTGGPVWGRGGIDKVPAWLTAGEWVLSTDEVKRIGLENLERFHNNPLKRNGKPLAEGMFMQLGGAVASGTATAGPDNEAERVIARIARFMTGEHGKPYQYAGVGNPSWDCSGLWSGIQHVINNRDPRSGRLFSTESDFGSLGWAQGLGRISIGIMRGGGGPNSHMAGTVDGRNAESGGSHGVQWGGAAIGADNSMFTLHFHWPEIGGAFVSGGATSGSAGSGNALMRMLRSRVADAFDAVVNPIGDAIPEFGGAWGAFPRKAFDTFRDKVRDFLLGKADEVDATQSFDGGNTPWDISAGVAQWRPNVIAALQREGFPVTERNINLTLAQIQSESSGNPNAIQQVQDVNSGGNEAAGLLQVIPGTFATYRNPALPNDRTNPDASISAALRYYRARYGDDLGVMWGQGHGYDLGGLARGMGLMPKYTIEPERVLSPHQTKLFEAMVAALELIGLKVPDLTQRPIETDFLDRTESAFDEQGQLLSDTRSVIERTATSSELAAAARNEQLMAITSQIVEQLTAKVLTPVIEAGFAKAIDSATTEQLFRDMGQTIGGIVAAAVSAALSSATSYDSGGLWPSGTAGWNLSGSDEFVLGPSATQRFIATRAAGSLSGTATGSGNPATLGADLLGVGGGLGAVANLLIGVWLKVIGVEIEVRDTLIGVAKDVRAMRGDLVPAFEATGELISDTSAYIQRTETSRETAEAEKARIWREIVAGTIKFIITSIILPAIEAGINGLVKAATTGIGAAIGTAIAPGVGTAVGAIAGDILGSMATAAIGGVADIALGVIGASLIGVVDALFGFDEGGVAFGRGLMPKGVIAPERVLSPRQTDSFDRLVALLETGAMRRTTINAPFTVTGGARGGEQARDRLLTLLNN